MRGFVLLSLSFRSCPAGASKLKFAVAGKPQTQDASLLSAIDEQINRGTHDT